MKTPSPLEIKKLGSHGVQIKWASGELHQISSESLRKNCPSATSRAARGDTSHDKPLQPKKSSLRVVEATADESTSLEKIWPIGNYAIGLRWLDGHDTGIYPYKLLYKLGSEEHSS